MMKVLHLVACTIIFNMFDDPDWKREVLKVMKNGQFSAFNCLGPVPLVFRQFKEWLMLELHKII